MSHWLCGSISDRLLLVCSLLFIAWLWWYVQQQLGDAPPHVYIYHNQTLLAHYPLSDMERDFDAHGDLGISRIHIAHNTVSMIAAPCRHKRCILSGEHHHTGDVIACVPNHILVVIRGNQGQLTPDAVAE
jgi:hypothetical protein